MVRGSSPRGASDAFVAGRPRPYRRLDLKLAPASAAAQGSKGAVESTVAILVAAAPFARPTAERLTAAITGWLQRDRRTVLPATVGDATVELTDDPTPDQQRALDALLQTPSDPDRAAQE